MGILILIIAVIVIAIAMANSSGKELAELKQRYETALTGSDKRLALDCGRAYYSALRKKKVLTIYDEQAISNDLAAMG
jgi:hypothetical protein